jgi:Anti-sigma-K factor rskA
MQCPNCHALIEENTAFCGNCGKQTIQVQVTGATARYKTNPPDNLLTVISSRESRGRQNSVEESPPRGNLPYVPASDRPKQADSPLQPSRLQPRRGNFRRIALFAALILLLIVGASVGASVFLKKNSTPVGASANGQVVFIDGQNSTGYTDALKMMINGLQMPPSGFQYDAWFVNEQAEQSVPLGTLLAKDGAFTLNFAGDGHHTNLLGVGNKIEITLEQGNVKLPTGKVILAGAFPPQAFIHVKHLLFSFPPTPGQIGLLVGLQDQTQLLNSQALALRNLAASGNVFAFAIQCVAQSLIDIIEGAHGPHFKQLPRQCVFLNITKTGDGFGLLSPNSYVSSAAEHASLAATRSDATDNIREQAGDVEIATNNITGWVTTIEQDVLNLLTNLNNTTHVQEIVTLSDQAHHGVDRDGDSQVNPVPGEAGAIQAYLHGQLMATLALVPVS